MKLPFAFVAVLIAVVITQDVFKADGRVVNKVNTEADQTPLFDEPAESKKVRLLHQFPSRIQFANGWQNLQ